MNHGDEIKYCQYLKKELTGHECNAVQRQREKDYEDDPLYGDPFYEVHIREMCEGCDWLDINP